MDPVTIIYAIVMLVAVLVAYAMMSSQKSTLKPSTIESQTADEGGNIPVVFGTRDVSMNIVWDGDSYYRAYKKSGGKK